jgi:hypothetical protein
MKKPFAHVLYIERSGEPEPWVSLYQTLPEAEAALRSYTAAIFVGGLDGIPDDQIIETLAEHDASEVHIYAVTIDRRNNEQASAEVQPFARAKAA